MPPKKAAAAAAAKASSKSATATKQTAAKKTTAAAAATRGVTDTTKAGRNLNTGKTKVPVKTKQEKTAIAKPRMSSKTATVSSAPEPKKRKAEVTHEAPPREPKKARIAKPKPKVVINHPPTTKLNVYVCGEGSSGELGLGTAKNAVDVKRPRLNHLLSAEEVGVVQVAVGGMHCVALTHDNKILTWGVNDQGALGRDTTWEGGYKDIDENKSDSSSEDDSDSGLNPYESTPTAIPSESFPEGTVFVEVAAGDSSSFALTDDGLVYGWGTFRVRFSMPQSKCKADSGYRATMAFSGSILNIESRGPRFSSRRSRRLSIWLAGIIMFLLWTIRVLSSPGDLVNSINLAVALLNETS